MRDIFVRIDRKVHGGTRHLEKPLLAKLQPRPVHGGTRHLETRDELAIDGISVHGGTRHLEKFRIL